MRNEVKNSPLNLILVSICVFVGVGFISGAEIWFYFARFNIHMLFGLIVFAIFCFLIVYFEIKSADYISSKCKIKRISLAISELLVASAMVAGLIETTRTLFGGLWLLVFVIAILLMIFIFWRGMKSMIIYNYFVMLFIVFVIICLFLFNNNIFFNLRQNLQLEFNFKELFFSSIFPIIYIFMNSSEMRPILSNYPKNKTKKQKVIFSIVLTLSLILLIFILSLFLIINRGVTKFSMPFLLFFNKSNIVIKSLFLFGLIMCLLSTAIACLNGVKEKIEFSKNDVNFIKVLVILLSLLFGQIPFKFFVKIVYPTIGIVNLIIFIFDIVMLKKERVLTKIE